MQAEGLEEILMNKRLSDTFSSEAITDRPN